VTISLAAVLVLIWIHFIADFIFQTDKMALNKSSNTKWLSIHVLVYSLFFAFFGWKFTAVTYIAHWLTDFVSSRVTSYLWKKEKRHWFFVVIGLDQALHMTALILAYFYLV
jgi:hypothetical protein